MIDVGFVHGRFQILHNEHLKYILEAKDNCKHLYVGITSSDPSFATYEAVDPHRNAANANPCTFYERMEMIKLAVCEAGSDLNNFSIVPCPINRPEYIKYYIPDRATSFCTIYDKWGYEKQMRLEKEGFATVVLWDNKPKLISGTQIREAIVKLQPWKNFVPKSVYDYIVNKGIDTRIRNNYIG